MRHWLKWDILRFLFSIKLSLQSRHPQPSNPQKLLCCNIFDWATQAHAFAIAIYLRIVSGPVPTIKKMQICGASCVPEGA